LSLPPGTFSPVPSSHRRRPDRYGMHQRCIRYCEHIIAIHPRSSLCSTIALSLPAIPIPLSLTCQLGHDRCRVPCISSDEKVFHHATPLMPSEQPAPAPSPPCSASVGTHSRRGTLLDPNTGVDASTSTSKPRPDKKGGHRSPKRAINPTSELWGAALSKPS
jgi:hypothetical protein